MLSMRSAVRAIVFLLAVSSCSSAASTEAFCEDTNAFVTDRSVTDVSGFSAEFFATIDERLDELVDDAPVEVRDDLETLRSGFSETDGIFDAFDYDLSDARLGSALEAVDNEGMLAATQNIQRYLRVSCGIEPSDEIDPAQVEAIMTAFGVDRTLAECLNTELGDVANIGSAQLTPELLSQPVCGTSLIALLSGVAPPSG